MDVLMELAQAVILLAIFVTGFLVLLAGLVLICVDCCTFCWRKIFRRGKVYRL